MPPRFLLAGQRPAAMPLAPSSAQHHIRRPDHGCCLSLSVPQPVQTRSSRAAVDSTWTPIPSPLPEPSSPNPHSACGTLAAHLSRVPSLEAFGHRPPACAAPFVTGRHPKPFTRTVLGVTPAERQLTLRIRTKSLQRGSRQFRANGRNRYRDSPLRGGASLIALRLGRASIAGRAEPSITVASSQNSSSAVQHELRCFSRSRRSPAFTCREVMRIVVLQETPVPGRASRRRRSVHISHSRFAGLQRRSPFGSQLPGEMDVLPFCLSHWSHK